uniref:Uncharacterized protein n=2 Tax=Avena sativa TaxID=4498 RepID=A0ACD5UBJ5_AVESA
MASSGKVTITLGRSGKVVKRRTTSDIGIEDEVPVSGRKRPVRERLGNAVVDSESIGGQQSKKRRQTESSNLQIGDDGLVRQIGRDDLRLKLMRKGLSQKINGDSEQNGVDLREKLSRKSKNRQGHEARGRDPESRSIYDVREVPESGSRYGSRGRALGSRASTLVSSSARCADDLFKLESSGKPYPSWTADGSRDSSPEELPSVRRDMTPPRSVRRGMSPPRSVQRGMSPPPRSVRRGMSPPPRSVRRGMSPPPRSDRRVISPLPRSDRRGISPPPRSVRRGMSPPRTYDQTRSIPSHGSPGAARYPSHITRVIPDTLRAREPYEGKSNILLDTVQPANGISSSGTRVPIAPVPEEVPLTVTGLLKSMGLEKYIVLFQGEEVDMTALSQMKDSDLKDMGVPMGPRKKILQAAAPYAKQWQRCPMI